MVLRSGSGRPGASSAGRAADGKTRRGLCTTAPSGERTTGIETVCVANAQGRVDGLKGYHDVSRYPHARRIPGLVLYRFDAPLFFANAEHFRAEVLELAATPGVRWIVVAAEPMTDVDATAAEVLQDMEETLEARGIELAFAELKDPVRERLERYGLTGQVGHHRFYPTIGVAVDAYVDEAGVDWVDWEEAGGESVGPPTVA